MVKAHADVAEADNNASMKEDNPILSLEGVSKVFGRRRAVDSITLDVPRGAFVSVFGPNGAGKTTLLRILSTLSRPTRGTVRLAGIDVVANPDKARAHIGLISHQSMLYGDLTAQENLMLSARLYGIVDASARIDEMLEAVELSHRRLDVTRTFSRGMTQRLAIARAFLHDPDIVFLDEPYSGLDPHAVEIFDDLIERMRENRTFVMVSHDLSKGFASCTHALVMARGRNVAYARRDEIDYAAFEDLYRHTVGMGVA